MTMFWGTHFASQELAFCFFFALKDLIASAWTNFSSAVAGPVWFFRRASPSQMAFWCLAWEGHCLWVGQVPWSPSHCRLCHCPLLCCCCHRPNRSCPSMFGYHSQQLHPLPSLRNCWMWDEAYHPPTLNRPSQSHHHTQATHVDAPLMLSYLLEVEDAGKDWWANNEKNVGDWLLSMKLMLLVRTDAQWINYVTFVFPQNRILASLRHGQVLPMRRHKARFLL